MRERTGIAAVVERFLRPRAVGLAPNATRGERDGGSGRRAVLLSAVVQTRVVHFTDPGALYIGLGELRRNGLTPRGILVLALDARGEAYVVVPESLDDVVKIKVGDKLALPAALEGRYFCFDSIHRLPLGVLWNGDRRLALPGSAPNSALAVAAWLKDSTARNVFLGCAPHQPGSWWTQSETDAAVALHEAGFADVVPTLTGMLARRIGERRLMFQSYANLLNDGPLEGWAPVFDSPLGNILMLERRVLGGRLVITCERGLVETDVSRVPAVVETARAEVSRGLGVVGRIDGGAFAVTIGKIEPWGLVDLAPAWLVGSDGVTLHDLARSLTRREDPPGPSQPA